MSMKRKAMTSAALWVGLAAIAVSVEGCASAAQKLGLNSQAPDEFKVVAMAPLVVPPDYALRPPAPGEARPDELQPESQARLAIEGRRQAVKRSEGKSLLVQRAGGEKADPLIRYVIDDQFGSIAHKEKSFADMVMFWKKGDTSAKAKEIAEASKLDEPAPLNPMAEQAKIKALTGGQTIVIARAPTKEGFKLPGL